MKPQDAESDLARENIKDWYSKTLLSRLDSKVDDAIVVVMQRLHVDDLVGHLLEQGGWTELRLPAIADEEQTVPIGAGRRHCRRQGEVLHPEREPISTLNELKQTMGSLAFAAQYQQEPVPPGGNLIKWPWFKVYEDAPQVKRDDQIIVSWDTAMSAGELSDYSVCVVLQIQDGDIYVLDVLRERLEYPDLRRKVIDGHRRWSSLARNFALLIEDKGSGMSLIQDLRQVGIRAIKVNPEKEKILRMNAHTAKIEAGYVHLPRHASWLGEFRRELMAFPACKHDDQVDALSQALDRAFKPKQRVYCTTPRGTF